jgi:hypothetical protein
MAKLRPAAELPHGLHIELLEILAIIPRTIGFARGHEPGERPRDFAWGDEPVE